MTKSLVLAILMSSMVASAAFADTAKVDCKGTIFPADDFSAQALASAGLTPAASMDAAQVVLASEVSFEVRPESGQVHFGNQGWSFCAATDYLNVDVLLKKKTAQGAWAQFAMTSSYRSRCHYTQTRLGNADAIALVTMDAKDLLAEYCSAN